jgi:phage baseplate assembly protein W
MAIKLNIVKAVKPVDSFQTVENTYLYKDIKFDLEIVFTHSKELYTDLEKGDLKPLFDTAAVINSVKNILTTSPGQKILNPTFGLDLRGYLFETVSETRGYFIGTDIYRGLTTMEPRVKVNNIHVTAIPDDQEYDIDLNISIPSLNVRGISLKGVLNNEGYIFV